MPLIIPGETGVEAGSLNMPSNEDGLGNEGHGDKSHIKGKGKRLDRSKSHVMTNPICVCCGQSTCQLICENFQRRLITLAVATITMSLLVSTKETLAFTLLRSMTMVANLKMIH